MAEPLERIGKELVPYLKAAGLDPANGPDPKDVAEGFRARAETLVRMAASVADINDRRILRIWWPSVVLDV